MAMTTAGGEYFVVIGDLVKSRQSPDQHQMIRRLTEALAWVNGHVEHVQPLTTTVGDEFQGAYTDLGSALDAALLTRLRLYGEWELRFGLGWGEITSFDPQRQPLAQSGPSWWAAREALDRVSGMATRKRWPRGVLTAFQGGPPSLTKTVNALLLCRDTILEGMDERDVQIALGMFLNKQQKEIARELGVRSPSVARRQSDHGINAIFRAHEILRGVVP